MKTITIDHPLRSISYKLRKNSFPLNTEARALDSYRLAHDQVWRMKRLFEQEKGEVQLALIDLHKLDAEREELSDMLGFYKEQVDLSSENLHIEMDVKFQVEVRDFYNNVNRQHSKVIQFYDIIGRRDAEYITITDMYCREEKPIDPLHFKILDSVFENYSDMQVDVVSLDKDLQQFLTTLQEVYNFLDTYIQHYNILYKAYGTILHKAAQLTKDVQALKRVWGE